MADGGGRWRVFFTRRELACPLGGGLLPVAAGKLDGWLDEHDVLDASPFLLDPAGRYDVALNSYVLTRLKFEPANTQAAAAYDVKKFLAFLWDNRGGGSWRDARAADRAAFRQWRLIDPRGPRVALTTWDREVATVSEFYRWAVQEQYVSVSPVVQRQSRCRDPRWRGSGETPAESSHQGPRNNLVWLPAGVYRRWRDVGVRGFTLAGQPDRCFRGRYASRNAAYTDLMLRTGLRLSEQTSLSVFEVPEVVPGVAFFPRVAARADRQRWFGARGVLPGYEPEGHPGLCGDRTGRRDRSGTPGGPLRADP